MERVDEVHVNTLCDEEEQIDQEKLYQDEFFKDGRAH